MPFVRKERPFVGNRTGARNRRDTVTMEGVHMTLTTWLVASVLALTQAAPAAAPARFDYLVREDFFAGFAGDEARLTKAMELCETALAADPQNAEALVWHGSGLLFRSGQAFRRGDLPRGSELWDTGLKEMDGAVALAPNRVGVLIPRSAALLAATRSLPPEQARPLLESALKDYEHVLVLQESIFGKLGDHPKGELLFGLAEGYHRLGNDEKARMYFERLIKDAPGSGHTENARTWMTTGNLPKTEGLGCVGCHK